MTPAAARRALGAERAAEKAAAAAIADIAVTLANAPAGYTMSEQAKAFRATLVRRLAGAQVAYRAMTLPGFGLVVVVERLEERHYHLPHLIDGEGPVLSPDGDRLFSLMWTVGKEVSEAHGTPDDMTALFLPPQTVDAARDLAKRARCH